MVPFWQGALAKKAATNLRSKEKFCFEICELRDVFSQKTGTKYSPGPRPSSAEKHGGQLKIFLFGPKIMNQKRIYKKYVQSTRFKLFFHHRSCRSEASRRK